MTKTLTNLKRFFQGLFESPICLVQKRALDKKTSAKNIFVIFLSRLTPRKRADSSFGVFKMSYFDGVTWTKNKNFAKNSPLGKHLVSIDTMYKK